MKRMKTVFLALLLSFGATSLSATEDVIEFDNASECPTELHVQSLIMTK